MIQKRLEKGYMQSQQGKQNLNKGRDDNISMKQSKIQGRKHKTV